MRANLDGLDRVLHLEQAALRAEGVYTRIIAAPGGQQHMNLT